MSPADPSPDDDRTVLHPPAPAPTAPPPAEVTPATVTPATVTPAAVPAAEDGNALPVGTELGEFQISAKLGEGGFGIVYLALDRSLHRRVAIKEYMPAALAARRGGLQVAVLGERHRESFELGLRSFIQEEARLLAQFDHPALVKVYRFWEANGTAYMAMPFYEGSTLKDVLRQLPAPPDEAWLRALLAPLTDALAVLHASRCYHRDIAPDNVLLLAGPSQPLLLDFGAARRVIGEQTQALTVILKPGYAPLEQYAEVPGMKQGPWTDVYALAAVVYFAITGRTPPVAVGRIVNDSYQPLAQAAAGRYSDGFLRALDRALVVMPDARTPSIAAFRQDIGLAAPAQPAEALAPPSAPAAPPAPPAPAAPKPTEAAMPPAPTPATAPAQPARPGPTAGPRKPVLAAAAVAGLLALGSSYWALRGGPAPKPGAGVTSGPVAAPPVGPVVVTPPTKPAPPPPAPAPAPAAAFSLQREFGRILQAQTPGFMVEASTPKSALRIDKDDLRFSVTASRGGHVYVLALGPDGSLALIYPLASAPDQPMRAGQRLNLPKGTALVASPPEGPQEVLVIVSAASRSFKLPGAVIKDGLVTLPSGAAAEQLAGQHSGPGSAFAGQPKNCQGEDCQAYGAARFSVDVVR